jgi:pyruvate,water dikinase
LNANSEVNMMKGVPAAPGMAVGPAAVIQSPEDLLRVRPESILVCPKMSFAYSIAFQRARGIISELGGAMSTAATVARETGLPAVTGVQSARQRIVDGDLISIDGVSGRIQIISRSS